MYVYLISPKNYESLIYNGENYGYIPKKLFLNKYLALEFWFTVEKLWYYGQNNGTIETMPRTMELWFKKKKKHCKYYQLLLKKTKNLWL